MMPLSSRTFLSSTQLRLKSKGTFSTKFPSLLMLVNLLQLWDLQALVRARLSRWLSDSTNLWKTGTMVVWDRSLLTGSTFKGSCLRAFESQSVMSLRSQRSSLVQSEKIFFLAIKMPLTIRLKKHWSKQTLNLCSSLKKASRLSSVLLQLSTSLVVRSKGLPSPELFLRTPKSLFLTRQPVH